MRSGKVQVLNGFNLLVIYKKMKSAWYQDKVLKFIESLPTKGEIEKRAKLPQGYLTKKKKWRESTLKKIVRVIKPYGFT